MSGAEVAQQRRQQPRRCAVDGADPQPPRSACARAVAQVALDGLDPGEDGAGIAQQRRAVLGERDGAGRAREQPRSQILFQQPDLAAERGRQHLEMLRGAAEMQLLGRRHEASELMQFHSRILSSRRQEDYIIFLYKPAPIEFHLPAPA